MDQEQQNLQEKAILPENPIQEKDVVQIRIDKLTKILKNNYSWISYILLAIIVWLSIFIRTRNLPGLRDITTNGWTLGPDLDPFLFLRWAKYIVANGSLMAIDTMRNVPLGFNTREEVILHPYLMAWFHKIAVNFGVSSVDQSAVLYPVIMFALAVIAFFFFVRKIFEHQGKIKSNAIALIAALFLTVLPSILPRTVAGIPEKEASAFFFLFLAFYLFLCTWNAKKIKWGIPLAVLSGIASAATALVWGGYIYLFITIGIAMLISFLFGNINREKFYSGAVWFVSSIIFMSLFSARYKLSSIVTSTTTGIPLLVLVAIGLHLFVFTKFTKYYSFGFLSKIPKPIISFIATILIVLILILVFFGPSFVLDKYSNVIKVLVTPTTDRIGVTVAENRQPFFSEWANNFGPHIKNIPIFFWLFVIGSIYLYSHLVFQFSRKEKWIMTLGFAVFLFAVIFSRFKPESVLNGTNNISILFYFLGILALIVSLGFFYYRHHNAGDTGKFANINFNLILLLAFFFLAIVSARGAVRLIMMLVPPSSIIVGYLVVSTFTKAKLTKENEKKIITYLIAGIILLASFYSGYQFYQISKGSAQGFVPNVYTQQWQRAMAWVRDNTPKDAVFGHWWDYGYWLQSIGERATVLDGGNAIGYWNHLMGRYPLTGPDENKALEFLYTHNTTHFLIDSTDIGKYTAFSSIGSNDNYDRYSWISPMARNNQQTLETKNSTQFLYTGGIPLDEDINYVNNSNVFLPAHKSYIAGVIVEMNNNEITSQPIGVFIYPNKGEYRLPLRYAFKDKFIDFGSGVENGIFLIQRVIPQGNAVQIEEDGALIFLSNRTVKSQFAKLYFYDDKNSAFKLVHTEYDYIVSQLKASYPNVKDLVYFEGDVRGPIKIWEINYPPDVKFNQQYLNLTGSFND